MEDPELISTFLDEADEHIQLVSDELLAAEGSGSMSEDQSRLMQRALHNLKGAARMVGLDHFQNVVHTMEDLVKAIGAGQAPLGQMAHLLFEAMDDLRFVCGEMRKSGQFLASPELEALKDKLVLFLPREAPGKSVEPEAPAMDGQVPNATGMSSIRPPVEPKAKPQPPPSNQQSMVHPYNPAEAGEMLDDFVIEAEEMLEALKNGCVALEKVPSKEDVDKLFRVAHTLKGSSGMIGLKAMNTLTHRLEELMDGVRKGTRQVSEPVIDVLLAGLDDLTEILNKVRARAPFEHDIGPMMAKLEAVMSGRPMPSVTVAPTAETSFPRKRESSIIAEEPPIEKPAATPPGKAAAAPAAPPEVIQSIRVEISKLDSVINLLGELATAKIRFDQRIHDISSLRDEVNRLSVDIRRGADMKKVSSEIGLIDSAFLDSVEEQRRASDEVQRISGNLQEAVMRTRMVPVDTVFKKFPRMVRDISKALNKKVKLTIIGEDTEMDKTVIESIGDPMMHLIRNAIDHGVELPEDRVKAGKPEEGTLVIRAEYQGDLVVISISDDGAGLRRKKILAKAIERKLITEEVAATMSPAAICDLIFRPGFSTAELVTDMSGRGVGMDVVRSQISKLKGTTDITSEEGKGSTFTIKLPLTLAIIQVLMVKETQRMFALPLTAVQETLSIPKADVHAIGPKQIFNLRGEAVSLVRLSDMLVLSGGGTPWDARDEYKVVVVNVGHEKVGIQVEKLMDMREVVIKTLGTVLKQVKFASGTTIMGDGSLVLILDLPELAREAKQSEGVGTAQRVEKAVDPGLEKTPEPVAPSSFHATLLLVDDSPTVIRLVAPVIQAHGMKVLTAGDGLAALQVLEKEKVDAIAADVTMPRMDGYQLCREIRKKPAFQNIPFILFSSKGQKLDKVRGFDAGADEYFVKPFDPAVLVAKLSNMLRLTAAGNADRR